MLSLILLYAQDFEYAIQEFRKHPARAFPALPDDSKLATDENIKVCVRKRPQFARELKSGEFDVVTALGPRSLVVSDARMEADMVHMKMAHSLFPFDQVFSEAATNAEVYAHTCRPLVAEAVRGGLATCFMYGQTGSGKTHTLTALEDLAAEDLFRSLNENDRKAGGGEKARGKDKDKESKGKAKGAGAGSLDTDTIAVPLGFLDPDSMPDAVPSPEMLAAMEALAARDRKRAAKARAARGESKGDADASEVGGSCSGSEREPNFTVSVAFFEIAGTQCFDLLNRRALVHLRQDEHGKVHVRGVTELVARDAAELMRHMKAANKARASLATSANPTGSSRSHAVCRIFVRLLPPSKLGVDFSAASKGKAAGAAFPPLSPSASPTSPAPSDRDSEAGPLSPSSVPSPSAHAWPERAVHRRDVVPGRTKHKKGKASHKEAKPGTRKGSKGQDKPKGKDKGKLKSPTHVRAKSLAPPAKRESLSSPEPKAKARAGSVKPQERKESKDGKESKKEKKERH